eukprot:gene34433-44484_t
MELSDIEAQISIRTESPSATSRHQSDNLSSSFKLPLLIYIAVVLVTICAMLVPLFIEVTRIQTISRSGIFGDALRTSTRLIIVQSISIGCTLPTLSDVFLDRFNSNEKNSTKWTRGMWYRILFLLTFTIAGVLHISLSDYYFMPYLYIVLSRSKSIIISALTFYTVSSGTITNSPRSKVILLIPVLILAVRFIFETYSLVYPEFLFLGTVTSVFEYLTYISFFGVHMPWYYLLWRHYRIKKILSDEEKKDSIFMMGMLFYLIAVQLIKVILGWPKSWAETGGDTLAGYIAVQIVCILLAIVIPARFMRKFIQVSPRHLDWL